MKYYVISMNRDGGFTVLTTAPKIAYARKRVAEMIAFNIQVWGWSDGFHIMTENVDKEYHSVSLADNTTRVLKCVAGTKVKPQYAAAIAEHIEKYGR